MIYNDKCSCGKQIVEQVSGVTTTHAAGQPEYAVKYTQNAVVTKTEVKCVCGKLFAAHNG